MHSVSKKQKHEEDKQGWALGEQVQGVADVRRWVRREWRSRHRRWKSGDGKRRQESRKAWKILCKEDDIRGD